MSRKNKRKIEPHKHAPSIYDKGYKAKCLGCAFAGAGFMCLTSDGKCLKVKPAISARDITPTASQVNNNVHNAVVNTSIDTKPILSSKRRTVNNAKIK